jgi:hypothetical protein
MEDGSIAFECNFVSCKSIAWILVLKNSNKKTPEVWFIGKNTHFESENFDLKSNIVFGG